MTNNKICVSEEKLVRDFFRARKELSERRQLKVQYAISFFKEKCRKIPSGRQTLVTQSPIAE